MGCKLSTNHTQKYDEVINISSIKLSSNTKSLFKSYTSNTTTEFNKIFQNKLFIGRVVDIYDGDTITCIINVFGGFFMLNIRLSDIDTCEMKAKNEKCKELALKARKRMFQLITKTDPKSKQDIDLRISRKELKCVLQINVYLVQIMCGIFEKYGRLLGHIYDVTDTTCLKSNSYNHVLLREKLAYEYIGGTKLSEDEQLRRLNDY